MKAEAKLVWLMALCLLGLSGANWASEASVESLGDLTCGFLQRYAYVVSANSSTTVGWGIEPNGNIQARIATLSVPSAIAEPGDLLVSSYSSHQVLCYDGQTGICKGVFTEDGGLQWPVGLTYGPDGYLYISSEGTNAVLRYDGQTGDFNSVFASDSNLFGPESLAFGPDGNLYVGGAGNGKILRYDGQTGDFIDEFASIGGSGPFGFIFGPDQNLYVVKPAKVSLYDGHTGAYMGDFIDSNSILGPFSFVFRPDGYVYVSSISEHEVLRYDAQTGDFNSVFASGGGLQSPFSLAFGPDTDLYVASFLTNQVLCYDGQTGDFNSVFASGCGLDGPVYITFVPEPVLTVEIDIKPGSCPNPVNVKSSGVLPVAILGTEDVNVIDIVIASIRLADPNVAPIRNSYEDVAAPVFDANDCNCTTDGPDGFLDLTLKFETQRIVEAIGDVNHGDILTLMLTGVLFDETPIEGVDCVLIRGKHKSLNKADINKDGVVDTVDFAIFAQNWLQSSIVDD